VNWDWNSSLQNNIPSFNATAAKMAKRKNPFGKLMFP
jgi:hypothetical protein